MATDRKGTIITKECVRCHLSFDGHVGVYEPLCSECQEDEDNGVDDSWDANI